LDQIQKRDRFIQTWMREAAGLLKASFHFKLKIQEKSSRTDLVTNMDKEIELFLYDKISTTFPGERIMGEETVGHDITDLKGIVWIVDPIDGTLNFIKQQSNFAIMIGVYENGIGRLGYIYDVMHDEMYWAIKGQGAYCNGHSLKKIKDIPLAEGLVAISHRLIAAEEDEARKIGKASSGLRMIGSAGLETAWVASGKLVAYIAPSLAPWDIAAGKVIAEEVGLVYRQLNGKTINLLKNNAVIIATPFAYQDIMVNFSVGKE